jgi:hypothetical protein
MSAHAKAQNLFMVIIPLEVGGVQEPEPMPHTDSRPEAIYAGSGNREVDCTTAKGGVPAISGFVLANPDAGEERTGSRVALRQPVEWALPASRDRS